MTKLVAKDDLGRWTWEKKLDVATKYNQLGNMRLVSEVCEVPYDTLVQWKSSEWWPQVIDEVRKGRQLKTNNKLGDIIATSLEILQDRLENGNMVWDSKNLEVIRVPINAKEAAKIANDMLDKHIKMDEMISRVDTEKASVQETLKLLASEFAKWAGKKPIDVIDVEVREVTDAVHEERKEGL